MRKPLWILLALLLSAHTNAQTLTSPPALSPDAQNKLNAAEKQWQLAVHKDPRDAEAFASLGVVLAREGKYPEAVRSYKKALALNPQLPGIQLNLGLAEFKQGHFPAALAPLNSALSADPQSVQARTLLGLSYY